MSDAPGMAQGHGPSPDLMPALDGLIGVFGGILVVAVWQPLAEPVARRRLNFAGNGASGASRRAFV